MRVVVQLRSRSQNRSFKRNVIAKAMVSKRISNGIREWGTLPRSSMLRKAIDPFPDAERPTPVID